MLAPFPSLQTLSSVVGNVIPDYPENNTFLRQLENRTLHVKKLTILPHSIMTQLPLLGPDGNDMLLLHSYPEVEELVWNTVPEHPPPDDLQRRWARLKRLITPAYHIRPQEGIVMEVLKQVEGIYWPPGFRWAACDVDDPFFKDYRYYSAQSA
jgi:hypothetical protein